MKNKFKFHLYTVILTGISMSVIFLYLTSIYFFGYVIHNSSNNHLIIENINISPGYVVNYPNFVDKKLNEEIFYTLSPANKITSIKFSIVTQKKKKIYTCDINRKFSDYCEVNIYDDEIICTC